MGPEDLIAKGFYIFPCKANKHPSVKWKQDSTLDLNTIRNWKHRWPDCLWGIDCEKSNLFVLDDDRGKNPNSAKSLLSLELEYGNLPCTSIVRTRSGGFHYYFYGLGKSTQSDIGAGLDTKSIGGFVIALCSAGYSVAQDAPIAPAPEWLLAIAGAVKEKVKKNTIPMVDLDCESALFLSRIYLQNAAPAIEGDGGDDDTFDAAKQLKDYGVAEATIPVLLMEHWNERCQPPWSPEELEIKAANAYLYSVNAPGCANPVAAFPPLTPQELLDLTSSVVPISSLFVEGNILLTREIKIDYLINNLIETPSTGLIFGDPSAGKSFLAIDMALAVATGTQWMKNFATPGIAVYFAGEGRHGVQRRIAAWRQYYNIPIPPNTLWVSEKRIEFTTKALSAVADELHAIQDTTGLPISICHVDTLARHMPSQSDENSARDMGGFINAVDWLKDQFNTVVAVIHHSGKMNKETSRGSSAIRGAMDWEMKVEFKTGIRAIIFTKQKESELPLPMGFVLQDVMLGEKVKSAVPLSCAFDPTFGKASNLGCDGTLALSVLQFEISSKGKTSISEEEWRKAFFGAVGEGVKENAKRTKFGRGKAKLIETATISYEGDQVHVTGGGTDD